MAERGRLRIVERIFQPLIPPACREEVLGDLRERAGSVGGYVAEALRVAPMVVWSRIRRTADPQVVLLLAMTLYLSYSGGAWYADRNLLANEIGLLRLAPP